MEADVYDCSIRGSTIGRTYSNYDEFSFYRLVTAVISGDFSAQFSQLDAYEQAQGRTYPGIRENPGIRVSPGIREILYHPRFSGRGTAPSGR